MPKGERKRLVLPPPPPLDEISVPWEVLETGREAYRAGYRAGYRAALKGKRPPRSKKPRGKSRRK